VTTGRQSEFESGTAAIVKPCPSLPPKYSVNPSITLTPFAPRTHPYMDIAIGTPQTDLRPKGQHCSRKRTDGDLAAGHVRIDVLLKALKRRLWKGQRRTSLCEAIALVGVGGEDDNRNQPHL